MNPAGNPRTPRELEFFGRMAASISHEIKNQLAIVKEQSGLISDLYAMAERGRPLDPARIKDLAARIAARADNIDEIVKRLNRFAHSVDEPRRTFDLSESLTLVGEIARRFAAMKKVQLTLVTAPAQAQITNDPFLVLHLLTAALERAVDAAGADGTTRAEVVDVGDAVRIAFTWDSAAPAPEPDSEFTDLLDRSGAALASSEDPPGLALILPKDLHRV
jgi:C4-dicarboxylate-specific signal transduction histidine kinase